MSYNTIYPNIYKRNLEEKYSSRGDIGVQRHLRHKHRTRHPKDARKHRGSQTNYLLIHERPEFINDRHRLGD